MTRILEAVFENGVLRPLERLEGVPENTTVKLSLEIPDVRRTGIAECVGILPDEDAFELTAIIEEEFERVEPSDWQ